MNERFAHTQELVLKGTLEVVFPLFGPIREKEWADDWDPQIIYSESELADSPGTIFMSSHNAVDTVWYINQFDQEKGIIEYLRVTPGLNFVRLIIEFEALTPDTTRASVTYTFTALGSAGQEHIATIRSYHPANVAGWEELINRRLEMI